MQCSNDYNNNSSPTSHSPREITRLQRRVQELEMMLAEEKGKKMAMAHQNEQIPFAFPSRYGESSKKPLCDGIHIRTARSAHETWYGPSSLHYFIRRATSFLSVTLQQTFAADRLLPDGASKLLYTPTPSTGESNNGRLTQTTVETIQDSSTTSDYLTPIQEEYFLSLYWQSYHTALFPILDEAEFKDHYQSLWASPTRTERQPSALVDITLALCMQYGISMLPATSQGMMKDKKDPTIAGRWHYRRSQMLLANELETPTISTIQCHLLCCIFLCSGSFQNMADTACAMAVRNAYMLGLHLESPQTMPLKERELRRRLWWAVHLLDSKIGMKLGRPFLLHDNHSWPRLPSDNLEAAKCSGSNFAPLGDQSTWLSFNLQAVKLYSAARAAHIIFYQRDIDIAQGQTIWDDPLMLESCAKLFRPATNLMDDWVGAVPPALKTKRQNHDCNDGSITGIPFSTDCSALDIEQFAPLWLQRQRIVLELMYHNLCINLHRPFISFVPATTAITPAVDEAAKRSASHAIAISHIIHEVLTSTSILDGWIEAFQFQWSAAMTLVGFSLAYPRGSSTLAARKAIDVSISVFDYYGKSFAIAASAGSMLRNMGMKVDLLRERDQTQIKIPIQEADGLKSSEAATNAYKAALDQDYIITDFGVDKTTVMDNWLGFDDMSNQEIFDMMIAVDSCSTLDMLW